MAGGGGGARCLCDPTVNRLAGSAIRLPTLTGNVETNLTGSRRPLQTRSKKWAQGLAAWMARTGFSPNGVSLLGLVIAALGAGTMLKGWWWAAAVSVQLRLLCNMLDGLIAVEHGKGDKLGGFFNEVPDRAEDVMLLLAAGYAAGGEWGPTLGWSAALLAVLTAYLRQTGGAMGFPQDFCGPLAKPQRMFVLTVTLLAAGGVAIARVAKPTDLLTAGLAIIAAGTAFTVARRTVRLMEALKGR